MTRQQQDDEWPPAPPKTNPIDDLRWETINEPNGQFAKLVQFTNKMIFLAVGVSMALVVLACGVWLSAKILIGAFG